MSAARLHAKVTRRARRGWSLVEVVFSVALLGGTLLGFGEFGRRFGHANGTSTVLSQAVDLAASRVERVKFERTYATIDTCATAVQSVPGTSFSIRTQTARTNTAQTDYKTITVTVTHARLSAPVVKTTAIAAF